MIAKLCLKLIILTVVLILILRFCFAMAGKKQQVEWFVTKQYPAYIMILTALIFLSGAGAVVTLLITLIRW